MLEGDAGDVQDSEYSIQRGHLWLLQTRSAKRFATAAVRLAVLLEREGLLTATEALERVSPQQAAAMTSEHVDPAARATATLLATGQAASPGLVTGVVVTDVDEAEDRAFDGEDIVLARPTTTPDDVHAMAVVRGIVTEVGGSTSHAAVGSRELGVACVVGCGVGTLGGLVGRTVALDAHTGELLDGAVAVARVGVDDDPDLVTLRGWAIAAVARGRRWRTSCGTPHRRRRRDGIATSGGRRRATVR